MTGGLGLEPLYDGSFVDGLSICMCVNLGIVITTACAVSTKPMCLVKPGIVTCKV